MAGREAEGQARSMGWKHIRFELARTREFPDGSASRCYLVRLPLDEEGLIDEEAISTAPARATVRRFWSNEADMSGYVIRTPGGWAFSYRPGEDDDESVFHLETHPIRLGEYVTLTEPDGERLPFRVASLKPDG
jgi:hypothetical protein